MKCRRKIKHNGKNENGVYPKISFFGLFRYACKTDICALVMACICSVAVGAASPLNILIFRGVINEFTGENVIAENIYGSLKWFAVLGAAVIVVAFIQDFCINVSAGRQINRIRLLYFKSILRQDIPWYDEQSSGSLISKLSQNIELIERGIGTTLGGFIKYISGFIVGLIISFSVGWKLSLVACAMLPFIAAVFGCFGFAMKYFTVKEIAAYARAGAIAGEVLEAIRTVVAFGGEKKELERYSKQLVYAEKVGLKKSTATGGVTGAIGLTIFCASALIFWYGIKLMIDEDYNAGSVITVFINVLLGSIFLGNALPCFQYFMNAQASAAEIYGTIERIPQIDKDCSGNLLSNFSGNVTFKNVSFVYPSRPDITILRDFSLSIKSGQTVALVGPSGSGKSTIIHMLQRFYDAIDGEVLIEDMNIKNLDLKAYRNQIGCVQQEPVLFEGTIGDNIRLGKLDATQDEIEEAAKLANAHEFIQQLPDAYETFVGERGGGMSGGQKQRIAIARALIRKPKLLLLDEATSALDTKSERVVQMALDKASEGRTVVVVAHRLTTVRNADLIMVLDKGVVRESGTHDELVAQNGLYAAMLNNQGISVNTSNEDNELSDQEMIEDLNNETNTPKKLDVWRLGDDSENISESTGTLPRRSLSITSASAITRAQLKKVKKSPTMRVLQLNKPELPLIIIGCFCCMVGGASQPAFALLYSEVYNIFTLRSNPDLMSSRISLISGMMVLIGVLRFTASILQGFLFGKSGEKLIKRIRSMVFEAMLRQEIGWFDEPENQAGALTARLATDAAKMSMISGAQLGFIIEALSLIIMSLVIAFIYSWQLTLVVLAFYPIIVIGGFLQMRSMSGKGKSNKDTESMRVAQEAIGSNRTVTTLTLEEYFYNRFKSFASQNQKKRIKSTLLYSLVYALAEGVPMFSFAAAFALGAYLVSTKVIEVVAVFRVFATINMSAQSLGRSATLVMDSKAAKPAAKNILALLDRQTLIPVNVGIVPSEQFKGKVSFKRVYFRYACRAEGRILKNFTHIVEPGQTVALVGPSGCGKSTLIQLVMRFYDPSYHGPDSGVFFDDINLRTIAPSWIRKQIGIVSQEPTLFDLTIRENIAYGDNTREVTMDEIIEAARAANIHDFITTLPDKYETKVGQRGSKLSGGQKQRIAIARALVRKPVLLLLDEATSALDNESERIVQEALDAAMGSRTSLVVAHRLSTVVNADLVVVLQDGHKIESGPPAALLEMKGAFYALHHTET
ncbi:Multidrug resistance protein [Schistosoma japonicum]|uniref:Multidrug resistance protein n=1 Tax=Schistosoma japonicum TaxID=6182 RepID=A0A4Z2DB42_SCHJA|nr:Multidrug resistance protein [Schistosoma japonicum]